ncbi:zinc finger protein castor homolog 1-like [Thrips palmi]|uniref:Zinc finger protein castor homolog 1-like n=1 Tax=Thrips palmi TaxID=161013 RepID=A0A6P9A6C4_THRPL|nr:zinc finger protein castor homolog 1-like [Thrips palmi]
MQWQDAPAPPFTEQQVAKGPGPMTSDTFDAFDAAMNVSMNETAALMSLVPLDRSQLYDLAEMLLSEMIPGWDEDVDDEDDEDVENDEDDDEDWEESLPRGVDPVMDASYRACILEAERYLVQCEGLDAEGTVIADLKEYLHEARIHAAAPPSQQRQRPPGHP